MIRRIYIFSIVALFSVSIIGVPLSLHFCSMMNKISSEECSMCAKVVEEKPMSCCSTSTSDYRYKLTSSSSQCCEDEFIFNKVEDEFIFNKIDINYYEKVIEFVKINFTPGFQQEFYSIKGYYCDSSPPFLINPEIHVTNHSLLI